MYRLSFLAILLSLLSLNAFAEKDQELNDGIFAIETKEYNTAFDVLSNYLEKNNGSIKALLYRSIAAQNLNDKQTALNDINTALLNCKKIIKKDAVDRNILITQRGRIYSDMNETAKAITDFSEAITENPADTAALRSRAEAYAQLQNYALSDADYNSIIKLDADNLSGYMGLAKNMMTKKQYAPALNLLVKIDSRFPLNEEIYRMRCSAHSAKGDNIMAFNEMITLITFHEDYTKDLPLLITFATNCFNYALPKISSKIAQKDMIDLWLLARAGVYISLGKYEEAVKDYNMLENELGEKYSDICLGRANCLKNLGNYSKAYKECMQAIELEETAAAYSQLAELQIQKNEIPEAITNLNKAISLEPMNHQLYLLRAQAKECLDKDADALDDYNIGLSVNSKSVELLYARATLLLSMNREAQALADFNKIVGKETEPKKKENRKPIALFHLSKTNEAMIWQKKVLETYPTAQNFYDATSLYSAMNKTAEAIESLRNAFEYGFREYELLNKNAYLNNLKQSPEYRLLVQDWMLKTGAINSSLSYINDSITADINSSTTIPFTIISEDSCSIKAFVNDKEIEMGVGAHSDQIIIPHSELISEVQNTPVSETENGEIQDTTVSIQLKIGDIVFDNVSAIISNKNTKASIGKKALMKLAKWFCFNTQTSNLTLIK